MDNGGYDLTNGVATGVARISYPFASDGDLTSIMVEQDYLIDATSYEPAVMGESINTGNDLKEPFEPSISIPACIRVDDVKRGVTGKILKFTKRWANVPADRSNVFEGNSSFPFPSIRSVVMMIPQTAEAATEDTNLYKIIEDGSANTNPAPVYVDYTYFIGDDIPTIPEVFKPTWNGNAVDFVMNLGSGTYSNSKALNGETFSAAYTVSATVPDATTYIGNITSGDDIVIDVQMEKYLGTINVMKTFKMKAQ